MTALTAAVVASILTLMITISVTIGYMDKRHMLEIAELEQTIEDLKFKYQGDPDDPNRQDTYRVYQAMVTHTDQPNHSQFLYQDCSNVSEALLEPYDYSEIVKSVQHPTIIGVTPIENGALVSYIDSADYALFMNKSVPIRITPPMMRRPIYKLAMVAEHNDLPFEEVSPTNFTYFQDLLEKPPTIQLVDINGKLYIDSITYYGYKVTYAQHIENPNILTKVKKK
ncbi:MAG: hypothetical protein BEN18_06325 [Epulopiscium sp. Nuni2H_MBin001]|nr:MAG: hypothetical protein BEN18_06325 [Epulopiscium sp. Nuni2H_MBin001]